MARHPHPLLPAAIAVLAICLPARAADDTPATADSIYDGVFHLLATGRQADAERVLAAGVQAFDSDARLAFFHAACTRSRFDIHGAFPLFKRVVELDPSGQYGQAAARMLLLDASRENPAAQLTALAAVVAQRPNDPLLVWMAAVECRSLHRPIDGIPYYERLGKIFDAAGGPGPSLFHQTFANLLDEARRYEDALPHRRLAVQLEPAPWSYDGLGNTLTSLHRWQEGDAAYDKATSLAPGDARKWENWAVSYRIREDWNGALEKSIRGLAADPTIVRLWAVRGDAESHLGRDADALHSYDEVIRLSPRAYYAYDRAAAVLERLGRADEAKAFRARADQLRPRKPATVPANPAR